MTHIPSLFVGSVVSGASFLLIHRELSHRERLSTRWILAEQAEEELHKLWSSARASLDRQQKPQTPDVSKYVNSAVNNWNDGVNQVKDFVARK